jgi:hypothetical protein
MRILTPLFVAVLTLVLLPAPMAAAQPLDGVVAAAAKKPKKHAKKVKANAKRKVCRKGYVLKTVKVKRKGKTVRVKRCRKKAVKKPAVVPKAPSTPVPAPPSVPGAPAPLFDPPGKKLEDEAARTYIERYLLNSRFTDCPAGGCDSERRYSHAANTNFFQCQLTPILGLVVNFTSAFFFETGIVQPDGSWSFNEIVLKTGRPSFYDWIVAVDGTVTGFYNPANGSGIEEITGLRYAAGARDCTS